MTEVETRSCVFCGGQPVTREHVFPQWMRAYLNGFGRPTHAVKADREHRSWPTCTIDFKARKVCAACNGGWMCELESAAKPVLVPLIESTAPMRLTDEDAVLLARWVTKTALTASLIHPEDRAIIPSKYFAEIHRTLGPLRDSVIWIAPYAVREYPVSSSSLSLQDINGFRVTGNVGCLAYQLTTGEGMADGGVVLPPDELAHCLTQIWPLLAHDQGRPMDQHLIRAWPGATFRGRAPGGMTDEQLRSFSEVSDESWDNAPQPK